MLGRDRATRPGVALARLICGQAETLALGVLEIECGAAIQRGGFANGQAVVAQPCHPVVEARLVHPQPGAADRMRPAPLARDRPVEERQIRARAARAIGEEQMVSRGVVLVDGLLDTPESQHLPVETVVGGGVGGDRGQVVNAGELHGGVLSLGPISAFFAGRARGGGSKPAFCHCERSAHRYAEPMRYSLDEIETFLTVMELGTISAAAARMNLSKSVISKRVSDFEAIVGAALFRRNAGRITPTEAAGRLAERLRPALAELVAATESAAWGMDGAAPLRGALAIAAPMSFGTMYLTPILARFATAHPDLELRIDYDDRARDLARDGFDIGIRIGEARDGALKARKLCEDRQIVVASPDYLARHGTPQALADLRDHQVISYAHLADVTLWQFRQGERTVSPPVSARLALNNGEAMRDLAIAGLGLAMLPGFIVACALKDGALIAVLPEVETRAMPIMAVWPPVSPMPAKLRAIIDHLAAELAEGRPWQ